MATATTTTRAPKTPRVKQTQTEIALALFAQLETIDAAAVPAIATDRHIPRKMQAALTRDLFKRLSLRGISVTTPNYSMASCVYVRLTKLPHDSDQHDRTKFPHNHASYHETGGDENRCPACVRNYAAERKVEKILAYAFPNHDNRSDSQTDYFDSCWSVS